MYNVSEMTPELLYLSRESSIGVGVVKIVPNASQCLDRKCVKCRTNRNLDANAFPRIQIGLRNVAAAQWPGKEAKHIRTAGYSRK